MPATALDPLARQPTFSHVGGNLDGNNVHTFRLSRDAQGGVKIEFEDTIRPTHLLLNGDPVQLGAGSEIKGGFVLEFSAQRFNEICALDFGGCNVAPAEAEMNLPGEGKYAAVVGKPPRNDAPLPRHFVAPATPDTKRASPDTNPQEIIGSPFAATEAALFVKAA